MLFEKAIRRRQSGLSPTGHMEADSQTTSGAPLLELQPQAITPSFMDELINWPDRIELLVQWQQVPLTPEDVRVQETVSGEAMGTRPFYASVASDKPDLASMSKYQAIALKYNNLMCLYRGHLDEVVYGCESKDLKLQVPDQVYIKPYGHQRAGMLMQSREKAGEGGWNITAPKIGTRGNQMVPLLVYGCHAPQGCKLTNIEQVYASIGTTGKDTSVRLYKESQLRQEGVVPPQGGTVQGWRYHFVDTPANTSLIGDITHQKVQVHITMGDVTRTYVSVSYKESSESDQLIYVTFIPTEERRDA